MPPLGACAVKRKERIKAMSDDKPITIHCANCDGQNIKADAYADWNDELQQWELCSVFDHKICDDCGGECSTVEKAMHQ